MDDFVPFLKKLKEYDVNEILFDIWKTFAVQEFIIQLNTEGLPTSQLYEDGIDSLGVGLGNYTPFSIEIKLAGGESGLGDTRIDHITLKDRGVFYDSFKVIPKKNGFGIIANFIVEDGKDLRDRFGNNLKGLTKENERILIDFIKPIFDRHPKNRLL